MTRQAHARKSELVALFGGACQRCGYSRYERALQFHHKDPATKPPRSGRASLRDVARYPKRFEMLCANCHIEEHAERDAKQVIFATCLFCGKQFATQPNRAIDGRDKYCSRACHHSHRPILAVDTKRIVARLWKHVRKGPGCWEWTGSLKGGQSPQISVMSAAGKNRPRTAAQVAYEAVHGPLPNGARLRRSCNNPLCVRPEIGHVIRSR